MVEKEAYSLYVAAAGDIRSFAGELLHCHLVRRTAELPSAHPKDTYHVPLLSFS